MLEECGEDRWRCDELEFGSNEEQRDLLVASAQRELLARRIGTENW